eukprot:2638483-Amphidinium_carterae.1
MEVTSRHGHFAFVVNQRLNFRCLFAQAGAAAAVEHSRRGGVARLLERGLLPSAQHCGADRLWTLLLSELMQLVPRIPRFEEKSATASTCRALCLVFRMGVSRPSARLVASGPRPSVPALRTLLRAKFLKGAPERRFMQLCTMASDALD